MPTAARRAAATSRGVPWPVSRRYLSLESLAHLDDTEPRQLAAVAS